MTPCELKFLLFSPNSVFKSREKIKSVRKGNRSFHGWAQFTITSAESSPVRLSRQRHAQKPRTQISVGAVSTYSLVVIGQGFTLLLIRFFSHGKGLIVKCLACVEHRFKNLSLFRCGVDSELTSLNHISYARFYRTVLWLGCDNGNQRKPLS